MLLAQMQQSSACRVAQKLDARMCRWLMQLREVLDNDELRLTQEVLSQILGVQRGSISIVAG
jgi:hypothetical protein